MNEAVSIRFRIVEPMIFRAQGEFDPFTRGTYSRARTFATPSPSTVAGALATYCISTLGKVQPRAENWIQQYLDVLGADVEIKGPLLKLSNKHFAEDKTSNCFLTMQGIKQKCELLYERLSKKPESLKQLEEYSKADRHEIKSNNVVKINKDMRIGVMLLSRDDKKTPQKTAKEGYLYGAEYLDYTSVSFDKNKPRFNRAEFIVELRGSLASDFSSTRIVPIKFGGEGRAALLSVERTAEILDTLLKTLWNGETSYDGFVGLYLATPALFNGGKRVVEYIRQWAEINNSEFVGLGGESEAIGAGFIMRDRIRKPIYTALKPGSIIMLKGKFDLTEMYKKSIGEAGMLGYGTLIPVPLYRETTSTEVSG